jgi:hypothetical protein
MTIIADNRTANLSLSYAQLYFDAGYTNPQIERPM